MSLDDKLNQYRLLEAEFGQLDMLLRVRHEIFKLRVAQLEQRRGAIESRLALTLTILLGAVPALYTILPNSQKYWPSILLILSAVYLILLIHQLRKQRQEDQETRSKLPPGRDRALEDDPIYILTIVSMAGTRLSAARVVLEGV